MRKKILHGIWRLCQVGRDSLIIILMIAIIIMMFVVEPFVSKTVLLIIVIVTAVTSSYFINFITSLFDHLADWIEERI